MFEHYLAAAWVSVKSVGLFAGTILASMFGSGMLATVGVTEASTVTLGLVFAVCGSLVGAAVTVVLVAVWLEHRFTKLESGQDEINRRLDTLPCDEEKCRAKSKR